MILRMYFECNTNVFFNNLYGLIIFICILFLYFSSVVFLFEISVLYLFYVNLSVHMHVNDILMESNTSK